MKQTTLQPKPVHGWMWIGTLLSGLVLVFAIFMGVRLVRRQNVPSQTNPSTTRPRDVPADLDYSSQRASDKGFFNVSYTVSTGTVPVNQIHQWTLHVESADGKPVENATITVNGDMPQHGHGLPTSPRVTKYLGNGDYLVDGMKFQMVGWWMMDFIITANNETDAVHFNMMLK
jgi:YtkA-like protein